MNKFILGASRNRAAEVVMIGKVHNENCLDTMARMPDNFIDFVLTSPPYDDLRTYNGYSFDFEKIALELYRVTKQGGVLVWVVNDSTVNGSETLTSCKQKIFFREQCGYNIHDTMIWSKSNFANPAQNRYHALFEYMFVFSKGPPKTFNPIKDIPIIHLKRFGKNTYRGKDGMMKDRPAKMYGGLRKRGNIWELKTSGQENPCRPIEHPATFSEELAKDQIISWSNENDIVYDPMGGSGTTPKMAHLLNRQWIMSEDSEEYCKLAEKRLSAYVNQIDMFKKPVPEKAPALPGMFD